MLIWVPGATWRTTERIDAIPGSAPVGTCQAFPTPAAEAIDAEPRPTATLMIVASRIGTTGGQHGICQRYIREIRRLDGRHVASVNDPTFP